MALQLEREAILNVRVPKRDVEEIDRLAKEGYYRNRSDFVRAAIRLLLREHRGVKP